MKPAAQGKTATHPRTAAQSPASPRHQMRGPSSRKIAELSALANASPLVQAQIGLARMMREGSPSPASDINQDSALEVIQPKLALKIDKPQPEWYETIRILVEQYNSALQEAKSAYLYNETERRQALVALQKIESWTYEWFQELNVPNIYETPYGQVMADFLNAVQGERKLLVAWSMKKWDNDPPIANLKSLNEKQQKSVTQIWARLVKDKKMIQGDSEFRLRVLTDFSRLLETKTGRTLVGTIVNAGNALQIKPTETVSEGGKFAASPIDSEREEIIALKDPPEEEIQHYVNLDFTGDQDVETMKLALHNVRTLNPNAKGVAVTSRLGVKYFRFNLGSSSELSIPLDALSDASPLLPASRGLGVGGEEILAPSFINLGHELGHVLRSLQGISAGVHGGKELIKHAFPDVNEEIREEEFFNIDAVENQIRKQSGLSRRKEHLDWAGNLSLQLMNQVAQVIEIVDTLRKAEKNGTIILQSEVLKTLITIESQSAELFEPIRLFSKKGGDPSGLLSEVQSLSRQASRLPSLSDLSEEEEETPRTSKFVRKITLDSDRIELVITNEHLKAAEDIAADGKVEKEWIGALLQALIKKARFTSKKELSRLVAKNLPSNRERLAEEVVSYLLETEF